MAPEGKNEKKNNNNNNFSPQRSVKTAPSEAPKFADYEETSNSDHFLHSNMAINLLSLAPPTWPTNWDRTAQLSCDSGEMILRLNFSEPFKGVVYPDHNRLSPCRFFGDGHLNYELRLPLRGCGTRQVSGRDQIAFRARSR